MLISSMARILDCEQAININNLPYVDIYLQLINPSRIQPGTSTKQNTTHRIMILNSNPIPNTDQWQQQQLQSESEVTLVKFDSELSENGEQPTLNHLLQKYSIEERVNFVINRDKGEIIDINNGKVIERFGRTIIKNAKSIQSTDAEKYKEGNSHSMQNINNHASTPKTNKKKMSEQPSDISHSFTTERSDYIKLSSQSNPLNASVWDDYWQQTQKIHKKLLMSICQKNNKILSELFNKKINHVPININYKSFDNWTPLHFASQYGNVYALQTLLACPEIYVNALTNFKLSALHIAAKNNKAEAVTILLKNGIQCNVQDEDGNTALHYAAELGYKEIINILLASPNIKHNIKNNMGATPKQMSTSNDITKIFANLQKDPNKQSQSNSAFSFFSNLTSNRQIQKLLMKVNQNKAAKMKQEQNSSPQTAMQKKETMNQSRKNEGRRENIVRMYQLLKEKKPAERVGIQCFKFYKKIGEGAFGEVYIVKKGKSDKLYALKAIKKQKIMGTNIMRYIQTQKQVLSLIKHPFIVGLHYAFQTQAYLFLVMDYCEGGDLGKCLEKNRNFDEPTVKKYAAEILLALQALHKQKIIYRDLKPDNIVIDSEGHALLTDFGLSKKTVSIDDINKSFCGTPAYLPLQIINKKGHNRMADWYQYGVVVYQLYTGIPPFYADTRAQLYQNVRTGIIRFPRGTPEQFRDLIKKLLSQNPEKRLGFVDDAESVKQHPWFSDINWEDVYQRKLQMPKIKNKVNIGEPIKTKFVEERTDKHLVSDWSFIAG